MLPEIVSSEFQKRLPLSPMLRKKKQKTNDFVTIPIKFSELAADEQIFEEIRYKKAVLPFMNENSLQNLANFLTIRLETQRRSWKIKKIRTDNRISYGKVKKNDKFFILIIDDNINNLKEYQKLSYNSIIIDFSDNFKRGSEIFSDTLDHGKCYDLVILDIIPSKIAEAQQFLKEIREIEKIAKLEEYVHIYGFLAGNDIELQQQFIGLGMTGIYSEAINEVLLRNIINQVPRGNSLIWK